jgi:uncharacterized repeat protein (TIGR01451 family)
MMSGSGPPGAVTLLTLAALSSSSLHAGEASACIALKTAVEVQQVYTGSSGQALLRAIDSAHARPGDEATYTITVTNSCAAPAPDVVIDRPVPPHRSYLKGSAKGDGTDRVFSVDGEHFARFDDLRVQEPSGVLRPGAAEDIKAIRWRFKSPIDPGQSLVIHFHAKVI